MDLRDVRRLAGTILVLGLATVTWMVLLSMQDAGRVDLGWTRSALGALSFGTWAWIGVGVLTVLMAFVALTVFGVGVLPEGWARGAVRQVQCDNCRAVFMIQDTGHRPITHRCPNCKYLGIYDGRAEPRGSAHRTVGRKDAVQLALRCRECSHRFEVTDTGVRPMRIACPKCDAMGRLQ